MKKLTIRHRQFWAALTLTLAALSSAGPARAQVPTSVTFFGDSFLDTGNGDILAQLMLGTDLTPSPPYFPGRASNGFVWADYLAASFGLAADAAPSLAGGRNFAIGTATTGLSGAMGFPVGMLAQFLGQGGPLDPTGLYVLFGGANDLLDAASLPSAAAREAATITAIGNISQIAQGLYFQGARNFLIPNLPDMGLVPLTLGTPGSAFLTEETARFNQLLSQQLSVLSGGLAGSVFAGLSLDVLFQNVLADAALGGPRYGLTNTTVPCLFFPVSCGTSVFGDPLHPTTAAHKLIADAAYERIVNGQDITPDVAVVPEPATVLMVGAGLLLCGVIRRRKSA